MNLRVSISPSSLLFLSFFLLLSSAATAFDITHLLGQYPEFGAFNDYLNQTKLNLEINRRETITILAVRNSSLSAISGRPLDEIKKILSLHVVLDYYDIPKLKKRSKKSILLTTLYQSTGLAVRQQGFLNVTSLSEGEIVFGSAVKGATLNSRLVQSVAAQPYNISVLEVSTVIVAPGIGEVVNSPPPPPASPAPEAPSPDAEAPEAESPNTSDAPESDAPADAPESDAPADAPESDVPADAPESDGPSSSPPSPGPDAADDAPTPRPSSGTRIVFGAGLLVVMGFISSLVAF